VSIPWAQSRAWNRPKAAMGCSVQSRAAQPPDEREIGSPPPGRPVRQETILRLAHAYEQSTAWHKEKPPTNG
jgi:hypothetical protein